MAGPYPQHPMSYAGQPVYPAGQPPAAPGYPSMPPPKRRRWRVVAVILVAIIVVAGGAAAIVVGSARKAGPATGQLNNASAKTAIQNYLDALSDADVDTIARNTLCGMYDGVHDKRSDQALAKLNSEAFRKQFSRAEVTSIDKLVYWSPNQGQVLFTMRVTPAASGASSNDEQAIAQVLVQDNRLLVCQYLLRSATVY